ncbi:MAG: ASCH domain-containing protein [Bacteroidales bacterium]|nr:ASCH domain-containing protein [Bacteroidales bacterium]
MKALSVKNPWADMIAQGLKTIEVRSRRTHHRGPLLICTSKKPEGGNAGCAVAVVELVDYRPLVPEDARRAGGFYAPGMWAWVLDNVKPIKPFSVCGKLGIFEVALISSPSS